MQTILSVSEINTFLSEVFPQVAGDDLGPRVIDVYDGGGRMLQPFDPKQIRPGGTLSGPTMMALADYAMYAALLGHIGKVELAVTTSLNVNFMRKPEPADLYARCELLKLGRTLAVGDVRITNENEDKLYAQATLTYSIPPER